METNHCCYTPAGRTNSEKAMEDGNITNKHDDSNVTTPLGSFYGDRGSVLTANGHEEPGGGGRAPGDAPHDDHSTKRINPLRIHLGKRPFVDNSPPQYYPVNKKRKTFVNKASETTIPTALRVPKIVPNRKLLHNVSQWDSVLESERDKPVPRLVPKSQLLQFQKGKAEKGSNLKDVSHNLGLQPMVKFKCRKCCNSFKTLALLKEHQLVCKVQGTEPATAPEAAPSTEPNTPGQSRVTRKVYLCSACGTYYENWNLFLHMREVHNRHICLFCLGMFSKAEKLSMHLINKHQVKEFSYNSKEEFCAVYDGSLYLMCCVCEEISSEQDDFFSHDCNNIKPKPVPVLVSKNAVRPNNVKTNGPAPVKKPIEPVSENKDTLDTKPDAVSQTQLSEVPSELESNRLSEVFSKDPNNLVSSGLNKSILKEALSKPPPSPDQSKSMPNGDDSLESDESDSPMPDSPVGEPPPAAPVCTPVDSKREGGIKLKLSLNNAKSPVIINSTVDPTIGTKNLSKPTRSRKPPKRYEKEKQDKIQEPIMPTLPRIKMTICDKADNSFVKATIFENSQEDVTLKGLLNNNLETVHTTTEHKPDNRIKTTIYDNKIDDEISLNRVPKLTVRVPKELLDKDSSSDYSSDSDVSDKLTMDEINTTTAEPDVDVESLPPEPEQAPQPAIIEPPPIIDELKEAVPTQTEDIVQTTECNVEPKLEPKTEPMEQDTTVETTVEEPVVDEGPVTELTLDRPLDKYPLKELLKVFLNCTMFNCIYCNHVRKIAVNCEGLCLHMADEHRFRATVDSITAEELMPETISTKVKEKAPELREVYINLNSYDSEKKFEEVQNDYIFECFQCYFKTAVHKDLYLHNRKMHQKTILLCIMCKSNFYSYSELLCHLCPGTYESELEIKFRCCFCNVDSIPSSFRLMVHLRKVHHTCDVCLEMCQTQAKLSNHVWKHKLHHLCYRCNIAYRNKPDITNHLFWKHGTQSVLCKRCLQKKWPHVYHFCSPPAVFVCDECSLQFTRAVYLKVHKRFHANEFPHACTEEGCTDKFVSKKLLAKHLDDHRKKLLIEDFSAEKAPTTETTDGSKAIPTINLVDDENPAKAGPSVVKSDAETEQLSKKARRKKQKEKEALLLDVNLPELNLSESDSSDESDSGQLPSTHTSVAVDKKYSKMPEFTAGSSKAPEEDSTDTETDSIHTNSESCKPEAPVAVTEEKESMVTVKTKAEPIENKQEPVEAESETFEAKPKNVDPEAKPESVESEAKSETVEPKSEAKPETVEPKSEAKPETVDPKSETFERKSDTVETKSITAGPLPETVDPKSDIFENKSTPEKEAQNEKIPKLLNDKTEYAGDKSESFESKEEKHRTLEVKPVPEEDKIELNKEKTKSKEAEIKPVEENMESVEQKPELVDEKHVLEIWDNFKKYQETVEKPKDTDDVIFMEPKIKTPPLAPIRKHVCDSDHDYCLIPNDFNGDNSFDKKKNKKGKKKHEDFGSSSSSSSSDSDSSCSCGSNCSCSSSSGSSSTSSSDSSNLSGNENKNSTKKLRMFRKKQAKRRLSNGSNVDVLGAADTPILIPEPVEPPVAETDLETEESDTDEEFYDKNPLKIANQILAEKQNQLMQLSSAAPSEGETSRPVTPTNNDLDPKLEIDITEKISSSKKKSKKKKKSKSSRKHGPIKINIPKDVIPQSDIDSLLPALTPNKIKISLQSNTVQMTEQTVAPATIVTTPLTHLSEASSLEKKRSSKRRRVPNKFYGYSSDEEGSQSQMTTPTALKPTLPPKLEWRKEDLPSPVTHKPRKQAAAAVIEPPSTVLPNRLFNSYPESIRLTAPIPDPEPPQFLMNSESSDSDSSDSEPGGGYAPPPIPPPSYLMSGTSSLPYAFQRPAVRQAREGESVYCYCRCPYDEVSEMIACDAEGCPIEWFHFECVGIMVPPKGKWYCPECRKNQSLTGYR